MRNILWFLFLFLLPLFSYAKVCPNWTEAQREVLRAAKAYGEPYDLGWTLAAIAMKESFVGGYVIRHNEKDSGGGSFGVTHVQLSTAMFLTGETNLWKAKQDLVLKLLTDDQESFRLSVMKLQRHKNKPWRQMVSLYNGKGEAATAYAEKVANHLKIIQKCL